MDKKLFELFHANKDVAFATSVDGKPHARIFQIMKIDAANNSIYFATSPKKEVYAQLKVNPNVAILDLKGAEFARINGTIDFDIPDARYLTQIRYCNAYIRPIKILCISA